MTLGLLSAIGPRPGLLSALSGAGRVRSGAADLARTVAGIRFPNPLGLAAGYDKDARALPALAAAGFGFLEIGTVTPRPQPGNRRPRVARLAPENALANALGFPSLGAERVAARLAALRGSDSWRRGGVPIGVSLGKMRETPIESAASDYAEVLAAVAPHADFLVVNVSSPNTPGLGRLQAAAMIDGFLASLLAASPGVARPLFAKLGPGLEPEALDEVVEVAVARGLAGLILTNTLPVERPGVLSEPVWGLSGAPIRERALRTLERARKRAGGRLALVGVGGIMSAGDARERLDAGADLIQVYTGLVYAGPGLIGEILADLASRAGGEA